MHRTVRAFHLRCDLMGDNKKYGMYSVRAHPCGECGLKIHLGHFHTFTPKTARALPLWSSTAITLESRSRTSIAGF